MVQWKKVIQFSIKRVLMFNKIQTNKKGQAFGQIKNKIKNWDPESKGIEKKKNHKRMEA